MPVITLTTDFGTADWFVGSMKGAMLSVNPQAAIVDITHEIPAGDIRAGAFALLVSYRSFPRQTVHCAVVDPGVGSERAPIVVKTADYFFVGPDNGVLSFALAKEKVLEVWRADNDVYYRQPVSKTFHGRDIFAPIAASLTQHILMDSLGSQLDEYASLEWPKPEAIPGMVRGEILHIDHFGNAITNIDTAAVVALGERPLRAVAGKLEAELRKFYQEVPAGKPLSVLGSTGFLEIAINSGHAARQLGLKVGDRVEVK